jgi:Holliday junction resolvase RusA-like endonuclease
MSDPITFIVDGEPVPKQSFRAAKGRGYTDPRVKAWQELVTISGRLAMAGRSPFAGKLAVRVVFVLSNHRRVDLDNLNKGTMDALNGICWNDDTQITSLHLVKHVKPKAQPGALVCIYPDGRMPLLEK